jgi:hypothetical protein
MPKPLEIIGQLKDKSCYKTGSTEPVFISLRSGAAKTGLASNGEVGEHFIGL